MPIMQYGRVARDGVISVSLHVFTGDRWTIEIGERCLLIRVIETNSMIVCWHWPGLGPDQLRRCQNLCTDSMHLNWIACSTRSCSSCMHLHDSQLTSTVAGRRVLP